MNNIAERMKGILAPVLARYVRCSVFVTKVAAVVVSLLAVSASLAQPASSAPVIDVWYGTNQTFGSIGQPQLWVNILGNVSDRDGVASFTYSLNGGPFRTLLYGPDGRRLTARGDFNIEIGYSELRLGQDNDVRIRAVDVRGNTSVTTVSINQDGPAVWPLDSTIIWGDAPLRSDGHPDLNAVAQIVDGLWSLEDGEVCTTEVGYNRVLALGDMTWTDCDITVPFTVRAIDPSGYNPISVAPGFGVQMRWRGNSNSPVVCEQPRCGWLPTGAGIWYDFGDERLEIGAPVGGGTYHSSDPQGRQLELNTRYFLRARVVTLEDKTSFYGARLWRADEDPPDDWEFWVTSDGRDPPIGSIAFVAHHVDLCIGDVTTTRANLSQEPIDSAVACSYFDDDLDGVDNCTDACPLHPWKTEPGICGCAFTDDDADGDGLITCEDGCPDDPDKSDPGMCGCGVADVDGDGDGAFDCLDGCPDDPDKTEPGLCGCGIPDDTLDCLAPCVDSVDTDEDGTLDCVDGCPDDPEKTAPGACGCSQPETDSDGDGTPDCVDGCPDNPAKTYPTACGCEGTDEDSDGDGSPDCVDECPDDPNKSAPGLCGCGKEEPANGESTCPGTQPDPPTGCGAGACGAVGVVNAFALVCGLIRLRGTRRGL